MDLLGMKQLIDKLVVFAKLREDEVTKCLLNAHTERQFSEFLLLLVQQSEEYGLSGDIFKQHIIRVLLTDENVFSIACESGKMTEEKSLYKLAEKEVKLVVDLLNYNFTEAAVYKQLLPYVPVVSQHSKIIEICEKEMTPQKFLQTLVESYKANGCGVICGNYMFSFVNGELRPAKRPAVVNFDDIIGCERQKRLICENIEMFISGGTASNMLLTGPKGTGKSSCVKALVSEYGGSGLCIVAVTREQYAELHELLHALSKRGKKFVVMLDDLSFDLSLENAETGYKYLKSILEGGVEGTPQNVLFCATSNRRALVTENWSDKQGTMIENGEIHASDAINEKQSLKDRFGLVVTFAKPTPNEFFEITKQLLAKRGVSLPDEHIKLHANEWELGQNGLSGRAARNLVDAIMRELKCEG